MLPSRWWHCGSERLSHLSQVTQAVRRAWSASRAMDLWCLDLESLCLKVLHYQLMSPIKFPLLKFPSACLPSKLLLFLKIPDQVSAPLWNFYNHCPHTRQVSHLLLCRSASMPYTVLSCSINIRLSGSSDICPSPHWALGAVRAQALGPIHLSRV